MPIDLYHLPASAPCRSVRLVAAALGVELNLKSLNLFAGEHLKPEFLKMNPMHTIPTIDDNGFYLYESRAICGYLVDRYGKNDKLYPKDPKQRALVDQRLYFDLGKLYQSFFDVFYPQTFCGQPADPEKVKKIDESFEFFDKFLEGQDYVAGKNLTIADLVLLSTTTSFVVINYDYSKYKNVGRWLERMKAETVNYEEINGKGIEEYKELVKAMKEKFKKS